MEQLERINKEINSVKTEVEEKQKMLPRFTSALEELSQSPMASLSDKCETRFSRKQPLPTSGRNHQKSKRVSLQST